MQDKDKRAEEIIKRIKEGKITAEELEKEIEKGNISEEVLTANVLNLLMNERGIKSVPEVDDSKKIMRVNHEMTEDEVAESIVNGKQARKIPEFTLKRKNKDIVDKLSTPMWKLESFFINEQEARRNSEYTIKHYQRTFKKLYQFLAYETANKAEDLKAMYESDEVPEGKDPLEYFGQRLPMSALEINDIQKLFGEYLEEEGVNEQTILSYFRDFKAIMYYAMDNGWIASYRIVVKNKEPDVKQVYSEAELRRLQVKPDIDNFVEYRNWVIIKYLLATGNRVQTIINLKVKDIDLEEGYANINTQKNKTTTRIGLVKQIVTVLDEYISSYRSDENGYPLEDEYLFCNRFGEQLTAGGLQTAIAEYNHKRGVQKTSIHLFRHTFSKKWITSGGDIASLQKMLGQSSIAVVQRYANLYSSDIKSKAQEHAVLANTRINSGETLKRRTIKRNT